MGCTTNTRLIGHIYPEEILEFVKKNFDSNAKMKIDGYEYELIKNLDWVKEVYDNSGIWKNVTGIISFDYKNEGRSIFYAYNNINSYENLDFYAEKNLSEMVKSETTFISLGYWGTSIEIIKSITSYFGGWFDKNDCDDEDPYWIKGSHYY